VLQAIKEAAGIAAQVVRLRHYSQVLTFFHALAGFVFQPRSDSPFWDGFVTLSRH
jgi:hypothetical protein